MTAPSTAAAGVTSWPNSLGLLGVQIRHQTRIFWRSRINAFFTIVFPLMFLVLFSLLFDDITTSDGVFTPAEFYAPALAAFSAASATYTNIGVNVTLQRDRGALKRVRGTPLPAWTFLGGIVGSAVLVAAIAVVVMLAVGALVYGVDIDAGRIPAAALSLAVGAAAFAALGLALCALVQSSDDAPMAAQATLLPMAFVSNVFVPLDDPPRWLDVLGDVLPLKPFVEAFSEAIGPHGAGTSGLLLPQLAVVAAWGILGIAVARLRFRWEPEAS